MAYIRKRGKYWQAQIRRNGFPSRSKTFDTKADAELWAAETEAAMGRGRYVSLREAEETTLREALQRYLREVTPTKKGAEQEGRRIRAWMAHPLASRTLAAVRTTDVARYRDERLTAGAAASTVRNDLTVLSGLYSYARSEWGMEGLPNPVAGVRRPRLPPARDRRLIPGEEERLLAAASYPMRELIILAVETGMRAGELLSLRLEDIKGSVAVLHDTKTGDPRRVPLSPRARGVLVDLPRCIDGRVFPRIRNDKISQRFQCVCKEAGITGLCFHDLRHEATSRLFERGFNVMEVATITGHKTLVMLKRYTHLKAEELAERL